MKDHSKLTQSTARPSAVTTPSSTTTDLMTIVMQTEIIFIDTNTIIIMTMTTVITAIIGSPSSWINRNHQDSRSSNDIMIPACFKIKKKPFSPYDRH